jgi:aspartate kinase
MPPRSNAIPAPEDRELVVVKFGGTSLATRAQLRAVARRLVELHEDGKRVVCVLSARGRTTDRLLHLARSLAPEPEPRELDALLAVGESISCALVAIRIHALGYEAVSLDGAQAGIATDGRHGNATIRAVRPERILAELDRGRIVLVTGFQGHSAAMDVTTLGRGGSDLTAVTLAAVLGAARCEICTDTDGVFTADPRVVPEARRLDELGFEEAVELAGAGARVLQSRAAELAQAERVPLHVRSTFAGDGGGGTRIVANGRGTVEKPTVVGVTHAAGDLLFRIRGIRVGRLLAAAASADVRLAAAAEADAGAVAAAAGEDRGALEAALEPLRASWTIEEIGSVSVVGYGLSGSRRVASAVFRTLYELGVAPVLVATSSMRLTVHLPRTDVERTVRALHETLGLDQEPGAATCAA